MGGADIRVCPAGLDRNVRPTGKQTEQERRSMSRQAPHIGVVVATILAALAGCHPQEPFYLKNVDNDLKYWKGEATQIEYPDVNADRLPDVAKAMRPFSLENQDTKNVWELTLEQAMQIALKNNKVMRNIGGQVQGPPDFIDPQPGGGSDDLRSGIGRERSADGH